MKAKTKMRAMVVALNVGFLPAPAFAATGGGHDEAAVRAHFAAFADAWVKGDARAIASGCAEDGDIVRPNQPPVVGRAAIEAFYVRMFADALAGVSKKTTVDRVRLIGPTVAVVDSSYTLDRDDPPLHARGASVTVLEKRSGQWVSVVSRSYRLP